MEEFARLAGLLKNLTSSAYIFAILLFLGAFFQVDSFVDDKWRFAALFLVLALGLIVLAILMQYDYMQERAPYDDKEARRLEKLKERFNIKAKEQWNLALQ